MMPPSCAGTRLQPPDTKCLHVVHACGAPQERCPKSPPAIPLSRAPKLARVVGRCYCTVSLVHGVHAAMRGRHRPPVVITAAPSSAQLRARTWIAPMVCRRSPACAATPIDLGSLGERVRAVFREAATARDTGAGWAGCERHPPWG